MAIRTDDSAHSVDIPSWSYILPKPAPFAGLLLRTDRNELWLQMLCSIHSYYADLGARGPQHL